MKSAARWLIPLALILPLALPESSFAQIDKTDPAQPTPPTRRQTAPAPRPAVFSFVLRHAGPITLDPFGTSGRREVLQLMAGLSPERGQFRRARLDRLGEDDWAAEGWYEIRGNTIQLFHRDDNGSATGRVDVGRYLEKIICLSDSENGQPLAFEYLKPTPSDAETDANELSEETTGTRNACGIPDIPSS